MSARTHAPEASAQTFTLSVGEIVSVRQVVPAGQPPLSGPPGVQPVRQGFRHWPKGSRHTPDWQVAPCAALHCASLVQGVHR